MSAAGPVICAVCDTEFEIKRRPGPAPTRCEECRRHGRRAGRKPAPCPACGRPKPWGKRRLCPECVELRRPLWERAAEARKREKNTAVWQAMFAEDPRKLSPVMRNRLAPEGHRWCAMCEDYKPLDQFRMNGSRLNSYCVLCWNTYGHKVKLAKTFGLGLEDYEALEAHQEGRCAICMKRPRKTRLAVDHDHRTGEIRGLLCRRCNQSLLGAAEENAETLRRAASYLEQPPARAVELSNRVAPEGKKRRSA